MRTPTPEQQKVLVSTDRIRVVRAAPGSGKTWLVAEIIRNKSHNWPANGHGIAALSFTRVGGEEIRRALGYELGHPHFVGTIDAYLFRYIVRPFLRVVHPDYPLPRLIPSEWSPNHWQKNPDSKTWNYQGKGGAKSKHYNLFEVLFIGEDATGPVLACPRPYRGGIEPVKEFDRKGLIQAKRAIWQRYGWLTHSDTALLASELLSDSIYGSAIKKLLLRRFPLVIVDELQDTGFFLGKSIRLLLEGTQGHGVLVGDPNQAIYEFNGARPSLFKNFESLSGAVTLTLGNSQRCSSSVVSVAKYVKETDDPFTPVPANKGRAFLVHYKCLLPEVPRLVRTIQSCRPDDDIRLIVRRRDTIAELRAGVKPKEIHSLRCPALTHTARAVQAFRQARNVAAFAKIRAALDVAVFGHEGVDDNDLNKKGIDPHDWKMLAVHYLLKCNAIDSTVTMQDWQKEAGVVLTRILKAINLDPLHALRPNNLSGKNRKKAGSDEKFATFAPPTNTKPEIESSIKAQTVHAVKGETHDVTIFVCPDPKKGRCPSVVWWSEDEANREEKRIAYVAMTRTRKDLILCVSEACYQRLFANQPDFVGAFESMTITECITAFSTDDTTYAKQSVRAGCHGNGTR